MRTNPQTDGLGNMRSWPKFAYPDYNLGNFHLAYDSPCVDAGDPNETDVEELDMDEQGRIAGESVDIGADEVDCTNISNIADFDADGVVNYAEFSMLSHAWLAVGNSDPNFADPNYNPVCDMNLDWVVDTDDLALFIPEWLWVACWRYDIQEMQQQMMMAGGSQEEMVAEQIIAEPIAAPTVLQTSVLSVQQVDSVKTTSEAESADISALLESIETFIDAGGDDAETWQKVKNLLEQSLIESEDTEIETAEF